MVTPTNALKLSAWLAVHEPGLFRALYKQTQALQRSPLGRLGVFGDDSFIQDVNIDPGIFDIPVDTSAAINAASFPDFSDVTLADVAAPDIIAPSTDTTDAINRAIAMPDTDAPAGPSNVSSGFWSSIGSSASNVLGAVTKVASGLLSPQTISAAANLAASYFKSQTATAQAQAQQAAVQTQLARVAQGAAPATLSYVRDPVTGAITPVYYSNAGVQPATPSVLNQLSSPATAGISPGVWIGGGLVALTLLALAASR